MVIVDPNGKRITARSKEEVLEILQKLAPKNKEQEAILAQAIGEQLEKVRKAKMHRGLEEGFGGVFEHNARMRVKSDGFSKSRDWRLEAVIPKEMFPSHDKGWKWRDVTRSSKSRRGSRGQRQYARSQQDRV